MIDIYRLIKKDGSVIPSHVDTWDDGKFKNSSDKMDHKEVLDTYNRGYYFTSEIKLEKVTKFEIPDQILEEAGIDPEKLSPEQLKGMFAQMGNKGGAESSEASGEEKPGLVKKKITVHRDGKTFQEERWVKPGEDEPEEKGSNAEPEKKPLVIMGLNKPDGEEDEPKKDESKKNESKDGESEEKEPEDVPKEDTSEKEPEKDESEEDEKPSESEDEEPVSEDESKESEAEDKESEDEQSERSKKKSTTKIEINLGEL